MISAVYRVISSMPGLSQKRLQSPDSGRGHHVVPRFHHLHLEVSVSRFAWLLSARHHYADPDVLSGTEIAPAYVNGDAPGSGLGRSTCDFGTVSAPANACRRVWE